MEDMVSLFDQLKKTYKGKKIFLTGHTGFKGSWLLKTFSLLGADVVGYALEPVSDDDLYNIINGDSLCNSIIADIRNRQKLTEAIADAQPDFIFHLAAQPLVLLSYQEPAYTFEINAIGSANVLDGVRMLSKPCICVFITTDKVYHNHEWVYPYRETDRLGGYDPYSASKACTELVISSYRNSFFNPDKYQAHKKVIGVGRAGNVIGGGDWSKDRIIPDIIRALHSNEPVKVRNPNAVRPWQHVLEPLTGYLILGAKMSENPLQYAQNYNFGPYISDTLRVEALVEIAIACWGKGTYNFTDDAIKLHEAGLLKLDISKAIAELGWEPKLDARQAINNTVNWYKEFFNNRANIDAYTMVQIEAFLQ